MDQGQSTRLIIRVQRIDQRQQLGRGHRGADLHRNRVADAAEIFHMRTIQRGRAHADPGEVRGEIEEAGVARHLPGQRLLVVQ